MLGPLLFQVYHLYLEKNIKKYKIYNSTKYKAMYVITYIKNSIIYLPIFLSITYLH